MANPTIPFAEERKQIHNLMSTIKTGIELFFEEQKTILDIKGEFSASIARAVVKNDHFQKEKPERVTVEFNTATEAKTMYLFLRENTPKLENNFGVRISRLVWNDASVEYCII